MTILYTEGATKEQEDEAEGIIATLCSVYSGHPWAVRVYDGGFSIRHLDAPAGWCMNCKFKNFGHSASQMKREIIMMAGEWLERCNLKRGRSNEDEIGRIEGIPEKYQLASEKPAVEFESMIIASESGPLTLRKTPRPQAVKNG